MALVGKTLDCGELIASGSRHKLSILNQIGQPLTQRPQQNVADTMTTQVVDVLEPVEINADQNHLAIGFIGKVDLMVKPVGEADPVGQSGEAVIVRHMMQLVERFGAGAVINDVAGKSRADNQQGNSGDSQSKCLHRSRVGERIIDQHRGDLKCCHAGEVQADDGQEKDPGGQRPV